MIIECTDDQVKEMMARAIHASKPMGMGYLHYNPNLVVDPQTLSAEKLASIDYYEGRMVKFHGRKIEDGKWEFSDEIHFDYQSWKSTYNSYQELFDAVKG